MRPQTATGNARQRGFTLTEVLVAISIFSVVMVAALLMYDRNSRVFKSGVENADAQQNTRVAFDKLVSDIRMMGYDYDRDGLPTSIPSVWKPDTAYNPGDVVYPPTANGFAYLAVAGGKSGNSQPGWSTTVGATFTDGPNLRWQVAESGNQFQQPDEQIEYAGPTAITIRGNFDYETDSANQNGREGAYQSAQFPLVTTANDEIVTYALVSRNSAANTGQIQFYVDMNSPGTPASRRAYPGGVAERQVTITGVDTTNNNPPYTLYRITFDDNANEVRTPLADNIRSMNYRYYQDGVGVLPLQNLMNVDVSNGTGVLGLGQYNPDAPAALVTERVVRSRIKSVRVTLVGMTENPDPEYADPTDLPSLRNYRKYRLETLVAPRNVGKRGMREQDTKPPGAPILDAVAFGHCGIVRVYWSPPITGGAVENYFVYYDTDDVDGFANWQRAGLRFDYSLVIPPDRMTQTWYITVAAWNGFGSTTATTTLSGIPLNRTKPEDVSEVEGTATPTAVKLTWALPVHNVVGQDAMEWKPTGSGRDAAGIPNAEFTNGSFRVYRGPTADFATIPPPAANTNAAWNETSVGINGPTIDTANHIGIYNDTAAAHCVDYFYRVQIVDACGFDVARNASTPNGFSGIFPPDGEPAAGPFRTENAAPSEPRAPAELMIDAGTSKCTGGDCTVNLSWPRVVEDVNDVPMGIDLYEIDVQRYVLSGGQYVIDNAADAKQTIQASGYSFTSGTTATYSVTSLPETDLTGEQYQYEFKVRAASCSARSADSPARRWPCTLSSGAPTLSVAAIDGFGTAVSPWLVYGAPTIQVTGLGTNVTTVNATLLKFGIPLQAWTRTGPFGATPVSFALPDLDDDDDPYQFMISISDASNCTLTTVRYLTGSATQCCLVPHSADNILVNFSAGDTFVDVEFDNQCDDPLAISPNGISIKWSNVDAAGNKTNLRADSVEYLPNTGTTLVAHSVNTNNSPFVTSPPAGARGNIPAGAHPRVPLATYATGNAVLPPVPNGFIYIADPGGTTAAAAPVFPTANNATVTDGTVTWRARPAPYRIRINFSAKNLSFNPLTDVCVTFTRGAGAATVCKIVDLKPTPTETCN